MTVEDLSDPTYERSRQRRARMRSLAAGLLALIAGCGNQVSRQLPNEADQPVDTDRFELVARIAHITDAQLIDEESPGRLTAFAATWSEAWRPHAAYSTQLLDGMIRSVNKLHVTGNEFDFLVHTGDACDNAQRNELDWFITAFDGGTIDPLTGPDDRAPADRPDPLLDPHHAFTAQGLYRQGVHGDAPTIPWYSLPGNHDRFGNGVFPIVSGALGRRIALLPDDLFLDPFLPKFLDPEGGLVWAPITPANPGPPPTFSLATSVTPNPQRRYLTDRDFVAAHLDSTSEPRGHGFDPNAPERTFYSVSPAPGLRLIALNSATPAIEQATYVFSEGAISFEQRKFLERELDKAQAADEWVVVATHHPSGTLEVVYGTSLGPDTFRRLLNSYPCVKLHLAGHAHRDAVIDRGGYIEFVTSSTLDAPQQGRVIELWRERPDQEEQDQDVQKGVPHPSGTPAGWGTNERTDQAGGVPHPLGTPKGWGTNRLNDQDGQGQDRQELQLRYRSFSHLDVIDPPDEAHESMFADPLQPMRREAAELAGAGG